MNNTIHYDKLGTELIIGDVVAFSDHNKLGLGRIIKLNAKMIRLSTIQKSKYPPSEYNKYPFDCVKLDSSAVTFYLLNKNI